MGGGGTGVDVAGDAATAVGALMVGASVAAWVGSVSTARTIGVEGGLAGTDAAFSVGSGVDGAVDAAGCSNSLLKAS